MPSAAEKIPLIGVIDAGSRTVEFVVFRSQHTDELASYEVDVQQHIPQEGWLEQDPKEILLAVSKCINAVAKELPSKGRYLFKNNLHWVLTTVYIKDG